MLGWRLLISVILIPSLFGVFYLDHQSGASAPWLFGLVLLLAARGTFEMTALLRTRQMQPWFAPTLMASLAIVVAGWLPHFGWPAAIQETHSLTAAAVAFSVALLGLFLHAASRFRTPGQSMESLGAELLTVSYVGLLLIITAQLRWVVSPRAGYLVLGSLVIATKMGDIGGYTIGRLFGKTKLVPTLSPGKTRAGGVGALCGGALGAWAWLTFAPAYFDATWTACPAYWSIPYGFALGLVGLVGDLCESLIKRDVEKKDSAILMPGFGGLLDLLDSILYAGPIAYILWALFSPVTWN